MLAGIGLHKAKTYSSLELPTLEEIDFVGILGLNSLCGLTPMSRYRTRGKRDDKIQPMVDSQALSRFKSIQ